MFFFQTDPYFFVYHFKNVIYFIHFQTNNQTKAQQRSVKLSIDKALKEDATVFQYDEIYDEMEKKKEHTNEKKKDVKVCIL